MTDRKCNCGNLNYLEIQKPITILSYEMNAQSQFQGLGEVTTFSLNFDRFLTVVCSIIQFNLADYTAFSIENIKMCNN
jgi:hypothetical protein